MVGVSIVHAMLFLCVPSLGSDLARANVAELERISTELDSLEKQEGKNAIAGEMAVAKHWITESGLLLKEGRGERAAILTERLGFQLTLIRALLAVQSTWDKTERLGARLDKALNDLSLLKAQYDRLVLRSQAKELTSPQPAIEDGR